MMIANNEAQTAVRWLLGIIPAALVCIWVGCGDSGNGPTAPVETTPSQEAEVRAAISDTALARAVLAAWSQSALPLDSLTQLTARGVGITDLTGIGTLSALRVLDLGNNQITDLSPLAALDSLTHLDLESNRVRDLAPLAGLSHLSILLLAGNAIEEITPLLGLPRLESLELTGNPLTLSARQVDLAALSSRGVAVTFQLPDSTAGAETKPRSQRFIFMGDVNGSTMMLVGRTDSTGVVPLLEWSKGGDAFPSWSPDGTQIAFISQRPDPYASGSYVCVAASDGSSWRPLTDQPGWYGEPQWSPDGRWLAFSRSPSPNGAQGPGLCRVSTEGGAVELLTTGIDAYPAWSPAGDRLAFLRGTGDISAKDYTRTLWLVNADGTGLAQLTVPPAIIFSYAWSPDGPRILYGASLDRQNDIWVVSSDGGEPMKHPGSSGVDGGIAWSPDGRWIAFISARDNSDNGLFLMDADGGQVHRLIPGMTGCNTPTWSPDGTYLGFTTIGMGVTGGLYIVELLDPAQGITGPVINPTQGKASVNPYTTRVVWAPQ